MNKVAITILGLLLVAITVAAPVARAQAPEKVETPVVPGNFAVLTTYDDGTQGEVFNRSRPLTLDINFVLALSPTGTYPLSLTLIQESGATKEETPDLERDPGGRFLPAPVSRDTPRQHGRGVGQGGHEGPRVRQEVLR